MRPERIWLVTISGLPTNVRQNKARGHPERSRLPRRSLATAGRGWEGIRCESFKVT